MCKATANNGNILPSSPVGTLICDFVFSFNG